MTAPESMPIEPRSAQDKIIEALSKIDKSSALKILGIASSEAFVKSAGLACTPDRYGHCRGCYKCYGGCGDSDGT